MVKFENVFSRLHSTMSGEAKKKENINENASLTAFYCGGSQITMVTTPFFQGIFCLTLWILLSWIMWDVMKDLMIARKARNIQDIPEMLGRR